jgi:hypothetical protein
MLKWTLGIAALCWFGSEYAAGAMQHVELVRDYGLALLIALIVQPWIVAQFES